MTTATAGFNASIRIDWVLIATLTGVEIWGDRDQQTLYSIGDSDASKILKGKRNFGGSAKKAYVCGEWLDYFLRDNTTFEFELYPAGLTGTHVIVANMSLSGYRLEGMETESEAPVLEGITFDLEDVALGVSDIAAEILHAVKDPDCYIGAYAAARLTDDEDVLVQDNFQIEDSLVSFGHAYVLVIPGGTGNMRWSVSTNFADPCSEDYDAHTDSIAANDTAVTTDKVECIDVTAALTGVSLGDVVGLEFNRHASHANDTVDADCYYLGVLLTRA